MVTMIWLVTMTALVWVLIDSLARESDAEKRRMGIESENGLPPSLTDGREPVQEAA